MGRPHYRPRTDGKGWPGVDHRWYRQACGGAVRRRRDRRGPRRRAMQPWVHLGTATAPGGGAFRLLRRGDEFSIRLGVGVELMSSRQSGSEEALAQLAAQRIAGRRAPGFLIGGLGMGFTLRAAQAAL